jgi:outer membrane protein insertion porin family
MIEACRTFARAATCGFRTALLLAATLSAAQTMASPLPTWPGATRIARVRIAGAPADAEAVARRAFDLAAGTEPDSARTALAIARTVSALQGEGWLDARVDSLAPGPVDGGRADLVVHVGAGRRYRIGAVLWDGLTTLSRAEAEAATGLATGRPFRPAELSAGIDRLLEAYEARALPDARALVADLEPKDGAVRIALRVFEGDSLTVKDVAFEGARTTRRSVLEKSVRGVVGLPYNPAAIDAARRRLFDLGVFRRVGEPRVGTFGAERGVVTFPLEEANANVFDGAIGFQGEGGTVTGLADLSLGNLGGTARRALLHWEGRGRGVSEFRAGYAEPLLFGLGLRGEADFAQHVEDTLYTRSRGTLRFALATARGARLWLALGADRTVLEQGPVERATTSSTEAGYEFDRRDDALRPRRGVRAVLSSATVWKREHLRPTGSRRATQLAAAARAEGHRRLGEASGLAAALEGGLRLSNEAAIPFYDLEPIGGARQLRGYREGEFRASRWGILRLEAGLFPAGGSRAFAFVDQGVMNRAVADSSGATTSRPLYRVGYGVGFEVPSGLGLVNVSLGWGRGDGPLDGKLHVALTNRF